MNMESEIRELRQLVVSQGRIPIGGGSGSGVAMFRYKSSDGDTIICHTWDGDTEGSTDIEVAKPYLLRPSITSRNSITYTYTGDFQRSATNGSATETQIVVPSYVEDDVIFAVRKVTRDTAVEDCSWLDLNVDGRAWARKWEQ